MSDVSKTNEKLIEEARRSFKATNASANLIYRLANALEAATRVPVQGEPMVTGNTSDGYHTFDELYEYRMLYNAHASHGWLAAGIPVVKSWKHSDGELCFGGGWFIVTATLPAGQVSNHYKAEHWGLFKVPEVELPPEYDGHTPKAAADRLRIEAEHARAVQGEPRDVRELLHAKCDCVPDLGPAHCHLCSKDAPVAWEDCAAVSDAAGELVEVVLTTADIETLGHLLVQLSPVTQGNSGATLRRLIQEMNIKEVEQ